MAREDLEEGISLLQENHPTPAVMILFRVAEHVIRKYYTKTSGKNPGKMTMGQIIHALSKQKIVNKSILGYCQFLNPQRTDSAHPIKRYNQEEGDRVLLKIKELLEEMRSSRKRSK